MRKLNEKGRERGDEGKEECGSRGIAILKPNLGTRRGFGFRKEGVNGFKKEAWGKKTRGREKTQGPSGKTKILRPFKEATLAFSNSQLKERSVKKTVINAQA